MHIYNKIRVLLSTLPDVFLLNNEPDALIIQIYSVIKPYMFRGSSLPVIRSSLLYIRHLHEIYQCRMYSRKLLMIGREDYRNM
jgi:hypothetical protein